MRYAVLNGSTVVNVVTAESDEFASSQGWILIPGDIPVTFYWTYVEGEFFPPTPDEGGNLV